MNSGRTRGRERAFTLTELMVTVAIMGILAGITLWITGREWQHEQLNGVASELEAWLDDVRRTSLRGTACRVSFQPGSRGAGEAMASVEDSSGSSGSSTSCLSNNPLVTNPFRLDPAVASARVTLGPADATTITFTPRGTVLGLPGGNGDPLELTLALEGSSQIHCIRISPPIGDISLGEKGEGSSASCRYSEDS